MKSSLGGLAQNHTQGTRELVENYVPEHQPKVSPRNEDGYSLHEIETLLLWRFKWLIPASVGGGGRFGN